MNLLRYFQALSQGRMVLWCYLIWYLTTVAFRFDPTPAIWLNSLGISALIGFAMILSVGGPGGTRPAGWQKFRLFLMPFCVSSFSALIKGHGYWLIFPPDVFELLFGVGLCAVFVAFVLALRSLRTRPGALGNLAR